MRCISLLPYILAPCAYPAPLVLTWKTWDCSMTIIVICVNNLLPEGIPSTPRNVPPETQSNTFFFPNAYKSHLSFDKSCGALSSLGNLSFWIFHLLFEKLYLVLVLLLTLALSNLLGKCTCITTCHQKQNIVVWMDAVVCFYLNICVNQIGTK
jgi:hypothetical protein